MRSRMVFKAGGCHKERAAAICLASRVLNPRTQSTNAMASLDLGISLQPEIFASVGQMFRDGGLNWHSSSLAECTRRGVFQLSHAGRIKLPPAACTSSFWCSLFREVPLAEIEQEGVEQVGPDAKQWPGCLLPLYCSLIVVTQAADCNFRGSAVCWWDGSSDECCSD